MATNIIKHVNVNDTEYDLAVKKENVIGLLDGGKIIEDLLPSYVDDVIEGYLHEGVFYKDSVHTEAITGESSKIYVSLDSNKTYRWSGTMFVEISSVDLIECTEADINSLFA